MIIWKRKKIRYFKHHIIVHNYETNHFYIFHFYRRCLSAKSCKEIKDRNPSSVSGVETIYPTGDSSQPRTAQVTLLCWPSIGRLPFRRYFNGWPDDVVRWGNLGDTSAITRFAPRGRIGPTIRADVGIKSTHRMERQGSCRPNYDASYVGLRP